MTSPADAWSPVEPDGDGAADAPDPGGVAGAILAAGASRRLGGRPKALLPWPPDDAPMLVATAPLQRVAGTMLGVVAATLRTGGVGPQAVITGTHHAAIAMASRGASWDVVFNPRHDEGQLTSVWSALDWVESLSGRPAWLLLALVDAPAVQARTIDRLVRAARSAPPDVLVVRPTVEARHGHPVLWHRAAWPRLRAAAVSTGARPVVRGLAATGQALDVPVDDPGVLRDVDTEADYRALGRDRTS